MTGGRGVEVRIALLGGFGATVDGVPVEDRWRLRKAKTLVKLLALAPGHRLHRDAVVEILWPDADVDAASNNLHQAVHAARRVLGASRLALRDDVLLLAPDDELEVDVDTFQRLAELGRTSGDIEDLRAATAQWTGSLLPEDAYEPWHTAQHDRLEDLHAAVVTLLAERLIAAGEPSAALALVEPAGLERPVDEPLHRARITALEAAGRRWDAIAAYEGLRDALDAHYAAEPDAETRAVYRRLLAGATDSASRAMPHNLPERVSTFVGRQRELRELTALLDRTRLLTLTGPGGAGKSRLALELARQVSSKDGFRDGIWLVELAGVQDGDLVASTTAAALGLSLPGGRPPLDAVTSQLSYRSLLLVLDNCEHLLPAATELVDQILRRCPQVTVVTTSRESLALAGETTYRVPSLELPEATGSDRIDLDVLLGLEAVQLFVERARQTFPGFVVDAGNAVAVAEVCRRLDGMPLALELAAARLAHLSVTELADALTDALTVLARRGGTRLDRQQTLAAALDWSHELLEPEEQQVFRRLAVFAGGFELAAARDVCGLGGPEAVDLISRLVDKSLVEADTSGTTTRYRLLEVVRQYADARLAEADECELIKQRHRDWFAAAAAEHDPDRGPVVGVPSRWYDVEQDNLRAALTSALSDDPGTALRLAVATWRFLMARGLIDEAARWLALAVERCPEAGSTKARALAALAVVRVRQGCADDITGLGEQIVEMFSEGADPVELAQARHQRAVLDFVAGDWAPAHAGEFLGSPRADQAPATHAITGSARHLAGIAAMSRGDFLGARQHFDNAQHSLSLAPVDAPPYFIALTLAWTVDERHDPPLLCGEDTMLVGRRIGTEQARAHVAVASALALRMTGDTAAALELIADARARFAALGDRYGQAYALAQRGHTLRWAGDNDAADDALAEAERLRRALRDQRAVAMSLAGRALVAAAAGAGDLARRRAREAVHLMERSGDNPGVALTITDFASTELMLGNREAALHCLDRAAEFSDVPGGHRAYGWVRLAQARLMADLDAPEDASNALAIAEGAFARVGELCGLAAVQRARKAGLHSVPANGVT